MRSGEATIRLKKARPSDAGTLARVSERAFHHDVHCGAPGPGGPPGYDSDRWQARMMGVGDYFKIVAGDQIVGGVIVLRKRAREYEVGRIFLDPDYQNKGIGTEVLELLWQEYPLAKRWTLDTPAWNRRTRQFYKKLGFEETGQDRSGLVYFEKQIEARTA
jgi:RimJ/RimL family protein N-acetyltransferase